MEPELVAAQQKHLSALQLGELAHVLSKFSKWFSGMLDKYPSQELHLELQPNANSLHAALCSGFAHHPLPKRIDSSFWYWDLEKIGASEWEPPRYPFQARWHLSLGLYFQRLQLIYNTQVDSNHH